MKLIKSALLISCLMSIYSSLIAQVPWPFRDTDGNAVRGTISGTPGEFRTSGGGRFHAGVDCINGTNPAVYAMNDGVIDIFTPSDGSCWNAWIRVQGTDYDIVYKHIKPIDINPDTGLSGNEVQDGDTITIGTFLGIMYTTPGSCGLHLHINEAGPDPTGQPLESGATNFINNQITPFNDTVPPLFISPLGAGGTVANENSADVIEFRANGHTRTNTTQLLNSTLTIDTTMYRIIFDKVDLVGRTVDRHINSGGGGTGGNSAPNAMSYEILYADGTSIDSNPVTNINFNTLPSNAQAQTTFDSRATCCASGVTPRHVYILTSNPHDTPYDRYWNTRLKADLTIAQQNDWTSNVDYDALLNEEAHYQDGKYIIEVTTEDIANFEATEQNTSIQHHAPILIDNFRPYLKTVSINELAGLPLYFANWTWNATDTLLEYGPLSNPFANNQIVTDGTQDISILVQASEPLDTLQLLLDGSTPPTTLFSTDDGTTWFIELTAATLAGLSGIQFLHFTGQDLAENDLLGFSNDGTNAFTASELPHRTGNTTWSVPFAATTDFIHLFDINPCGLGNCLAEVQLPYDPNADCDFRPYIQAVSVSDDSLGLVYQANWAWDNDALELQPFDNPGNNATGIEATGFHDVSVTLTASEPMASLAVSLNGTVLPASFTMNADATEWVFVFEAADLLDLGGTQMLHIVGQDNTGNDLLGFADMADPDPDPENVYPTSVFPYSPAAGAWCLDGQPLASGTSFGTIDSIHLFNINPCQGGGGFRMSGEGCIFADFTIVSSCSGITLPGDTLCAGIEVMVVNNSIGIDFIEDYSWDFSGADNVTLIDSVAQIYSISWSGNGTYSIGLTVDGSSALNQSDSFIQSLYVSPTAAICHGMIVEEGIYECDSLGFYTIDFAITTGLGTGPFYYSVQDSLDNYGFFVSFSPNITTIPLIGDYSITISNQDGCSETFEGSPQISCPTTCTFDYQIASYTCNSLGLTLLIESEHDSLVYTSLSNGTSASVKEFWTEPFVISTNFYDPDQSFYLLMIDENGCVANGVISCDIVVSTGCDEVACNSDGAPDFFSLDNNVTTCVNEEICINYVVEDLFTLPITTSINHPDFVHTSLGEEWYEISPFESTMHTSGVFCWTPQEEDIGTHELLITTIDSPPVGSPECVCAVGIRHEIVIVTVECDGTCSPCPTCTDGILNQGEESVDCAGPCPPCPTCSDGIQNQNEDEVDCGGPCLPCPCAIAGFDHPVTDALVECDGDVVTYGEVLIIPLYYYAGAENTCTYTGMTQNPVTGLAPGTHIINATLNNGLPVQIPITVGSQPIDGSYIGISATTVNPLGWCLGDNCDGSIDVSFSGISGEYTITWADCAACNTLNRSNLCAGTYSVTVLDEETGCSNTATFTLTAQPPASATDVQVNPTVFDNNTTVSYHMPEGAYVTLRVWHTNGTLVETLINNEYRLAGQHTEAHDGSGLTAGMYIYSIEVCNDSEGRIGVKN